jgi:type IV pilus assembly protein PilA
MAIPAFSRVRLNSVTATLENDARQLSAAANQFFLENNTNTATLIQLVGPGLYIESLSDNVVVTGPFTAGAPNTFTLSHPNLPAPILYFVDTGRDSATPNNVTN